MHVAVPTATTAQGWPQRRGDFLVDDLGLSHGRDGLLRPHHTRPSAGIRR